MAQHSGQIGRVADIPVLGQQCGFLYESGTESKRYTFTAPAGSFSSGQYVLFDVAVSASGVEYATNLQVPPPPPPQAIYGPREAMIQDGVSPEMAGYWLTGKKGG